MKNYIFIEYCSGFVTELLFRIINGLITLAIFYSLNRLYNKTKRRFYMFWSLGFLFYGVNILLRIFVPVIEMNPLGLLAFLLNILGFVIMMTGIGELVDTARMTLIISVLIQITLTISVLRGDSEQLAWVMVLSPYLVIIFSLAYLYARYDVKIGTIILGWVAIFLGNVALSFNYLDIIYVDIISTIGKLIVYYGMTQPTFSFLADDLRKFILSGVPIEFLADYRGGVGLINLSGYSRAQEIDWIKTRIHQNKSRGIRTILFSFYDLIAPSALDEDTRASLYLVRVIPGHRGLENIFDNQVITIDDDPNLIQIVLDDVITASGETTVPTEVLVYNLSNAIFIHGWTRLFSLVLTKIPKLKENQVKLSCFYNPEAHEDQSVITKFETLADEIIKE